MGSSNNPENGSDDKVDFKKIASEQLNKPFESTNGKIRRIQLAKRTQKELEDMATARSSKERDESEDEALVPHTCPSESSMHNLNKQLTTLPVVRAFNSAEGKLKKTKSK